MTAQIVCHDGKCRYKEKQVLDECIDCDLPEQIEHDLLKEDINNQ